MIVALGISDADPLDAGFCDHIKWFAGPSDAIAPFESRGLFIIFGRETGG